ncbi:hypothetical protein NSB25_19190 [Acetatifactor muris]|uniref:hypothetical protein n=1 Tax=Acetatifactor muris TaxID=879566 RepID=UPI000CD1D7E7|nr:hypothetical protein [Acetatifactor muris]MCR2049389.1 hypothetical protein [Acetatifactor muris]
MSESDVKYGIVTFTSDFLMNFQSHSAVRGKFQIKHFLKAGTTAMGQILRIHLEGDGPVKKKQFFE